MSGETLSGRPEPLAGLTVVEAMSSDADLALRLSAAMAGRIAADLGARVVILERNGGNPLRRLAPFTAAGESAVFAFLGAGKHSVLDQPRIAARILRDADAVIADAARTDLPDAVPARVLLSMLAQEGAPPMSEFTVMALGGLLDIVGDAAGPPMRLGGHQLAYAGGLAAYAGLAAALLQRPGPETARICLLDVAVWINWKSVASAACLDTIMTRTGRGAEWPILRCADGYVALVYQTKDWPALRRLCADPRLDGDRFATTEARHQNRLELADIVEAALTHLTRQQLQERAMEMRLPLGPVWEIGELRCDAQMLARAFLSEPLGIPRLPVLWNGVAFPVGHAPTAAV